MNFYRINAGHKAVDNGAITPLSALVNIADTAGLQVIWGEYYGQDYLPQPTEEGDRDALEELMNDAKLLWTLVDELPYQLRGYYREPLSSKGNSND